MTVLAGGALTLLDWAKRRDPNGAIADIVEMLSQMNGIVKSSMWKEGNLTTGNRTTIRTGLPNVYWRMLNRGVPTSKSRTAQITEDCGTLEAYSEVDEGLAELEGDVGALRFSEDSAFIEAMDQEIASTSFYGNSSIDAEEFMGLSPRYSLLSAANGQNILDAGGTSTDNSSIWVVGWGDKGTVGIFPKGTKAGITQKDLGLQLIQKAQGDGGGGDRMTAYVTKFKWHAGMSVKDWRYTVRICNIDISNLVANSSAANLYELLIKAIERLPNMNGVKPVIYMNRTCRQMLTIQARLAVQAGGQLNYEVVDGKRIVSFMGLPIEIVDALHTNEDRVV